MMKKEFYRGEDVDAENAFDGRRCYELNPSLQHIIRTIFPFIQDDDIIHAELCKDWDKPDLCIWIGEERHYISLKSGTSQCVHGESIESFVKFYRGLGLSVRSQKALLLNQYGDGTLDGSGGRCFTKSEIWPRIQAEVAFANRELRDPRYVKAGLDRMVFDGTEHSSCSADYLAYGDPSYFVFASRKQMTDFVYSKRYEFLSSLHIGPLQIVPMTRGVETQPRNMWKRHFMRAKWPFLLTDIQYINNKQLQIQRERAKKKAQ